VSAERGRIPRRRAARPAVDGSVGSAPESPAPESPAPESPAPESPGDAATGTPDDEAVVRRLLQERGVSEEALERALAHGRVALLAIEHLSLPAPPAYTPGRVAEKSGLPYEMTVRLWRALGFPAVGDEETFFTDVDLAALTTLRRLVELGFTDEEAAVQFARVLGSAMARVAETEIAAQPSTRPTSAERLAFTEALLTAPENLFAVLGDLIVYVWRRHLQAAARRALVVESVDDNAAVVPLAVGFADLVGYTALSQQLSERALGDLVSRFEETAQDTITAGGARVVKMIGDEVMFVADDVATAATIAAALAEVFAGDEILSDVRVGLARGTVLSQEGDYYGPVVNLASRLVNVAYPGTVVVAEDVHEALAGDARWAWRSLGARHLKDIGTVTLWALRSAGTGPAEDRARRRFLRTLLSEAGYQRAERREAHGEDRPGA